MSESKKHDSLSAEELDGVAGGVFFSEGSLRIVLPVLQYEHEGSQV